MPLVLPIGTANSRFEFTCAGLADDMGFSIATQSTPEQDAATIAVSMTDAWESGPYGNPANMNDEWTYRGVTTTLMTATGPIVGVAPRAVPGTNAFDAPPANCTVLVGKQTARGGRQGRGRFNLPAGRIQELDINGAGFILPATVAALQTGANTFYDAMVTNECQPVLLHTDPGIAPDVVLSFSVSTQIATQRRRMR